jgi:hypothetical protein
MKKFLSLVAMLLVAASALALPFVTTPSESTYPIHWYQLKINGMYLYAHQGQWTDVDASTTASTADAYLWCFISTSSGKTLIFNKAKRQYMAGGDLLTSNQSQSNINYVEEGSGNTFYICFNAEQTKFYLDYDEDNGLHSPAWKMHSFTAIEALVQEEKPTPNGELSLNLEVQDSYCMIKAAYSGSEEHTITLNVNGQNVNNPYRINRTYTDQVLDVTATVRFNDMDPLVKHSSITIPALGQQEYTGHIEFYYSQSESECVITADYVGTGTYILTLFANGTQVSNPYTIARTDVDQTITMKARIEYTGMVPLEAEKVFVIPKLEEPELDLTFTGYSISNSAFDAEGGSNFMRMFDKNSYTKWQLSMETWQPFYVSFRSDQSFVPVGYVLTTGDDTNAHPNRNPKSWKLYATILPVWDDEWELIATVTDGAAAGLGTNNMTEYNFRLEGVNKEYKYFRFEVDELCGTENGSHVFQLAELRLRGHAYHATPGDVNDDNTVDIADVNAIINMMLGKATATAAGDVTGDNHVDIADVNAVINIMLGK